MTKHTIWDYPRVQKNFQDVIKDPKTDTASEVAVQPH